MSVDNTISALEQHCVNNSGYADQWAGKSATYCWTLGKTTEEGIVNGVVRKLAGVSAAGAPILTVAGSFKIAPNGEILRFTGLPKKVQKTIQSISLRTEIPALETV
jgi:hypothetical protein